MDRKRTATQTTSELAKAARSVAIARRGIQTGQDFANYMSALMADVVEGKITPQVANAGCNAGGKLLKIVEMRYKYGQPTTAKKVGRQDLALATR